MENRDQWRRLKLSRYVPQALLVAIMTTAGASPASAVATVDLENVGWSLSFDHYVEFDDNYDQVNYFDMLPDGLIFSCVGDAIQYGNACRYSISLHASTTSPVLQSYSVSAYGGAEITNTTGQAYPGYFVFLTEYSSFNPGGSPIGVSVTDPNAEYASFSSSVQGTAGYYGAYDSHGCWVGNSPSDGPSNLYSCGVEAPDGSTDTWYLGPLDAGGTIGGYYSAGISAELKGVPEPLTLSLIVPGLIWIGMSRRKQQANV